MFSDLFVVKSVFVLSSFYALRMCKIKLCNEVLHVNHFCNCFHERHTSEVFVGDEGKESKLRISHSNVTPENGFHSSSMKIFRVQLVKMLIVGVSYVQVSANRFALVQGGRKDHALHSVYFVSYCKGNFVSLNNDWT